jgi:Xaa-Pro aminopeptidase
MISPQRHQQRRQTLRTNISIPILFMGHRSRSRNFRANTLPFRQESNFLYFTGCTLPNSALYMENGQEILFLERKDEDDTLWHGPSLSIEKQAQKLGFTQVVDIERLPEFMKNKTDTQSIATQDHQVNLFLQKLLGRPFHSGSIPEQWGNLELIQNISRLRIQLDAEELQEIRNTAKITQNAHIAAMKATKVGSSEAYVASIFHQTIAAEGLCTAYDSIVTVDGHILHNHHYHNRLQDGQLLLLDGGAEAKSGYATDVTRTWPVNGKFNSQQRRAYNAVLQSQIEAIAHVRIGTRYRDVHWTACRVLTEFLIDEGILTCGLDEALEHGTHALFFPHGVGHLISLDVHDMEHFGDIPTYPKGRVRSTQFGTAYLRLDVDLVENMVVTIEPGFYIIPAILQNKALVEPHQHRINFDVLENWIHFGGIRIEDDIRVTQDKPENLTADIPKEIADIEELIGQE